MHLTLDSWCPYWDYEGRKQDPYGLVSDLSEDNFGGEAEEALGKLLYRPEMRMPQKRVNLRRSEQRNIGFMTNRLSIN